MPKRKKVVLAQPPPEWSPQLVRRMGCVMRDGAACRHPGPKRAVSLGGRIVCPGCNDLCRMPHGVARGDLVEIKTL